MSRSVPGNISATAVTLKSVNTFNLLLLATFYLFNLQLKLTEDLTLDYCNGAMQFSQTAVKKPT